MLMPSAKAAIKEGYAAVLRGSGIGRAWRATRGDRWGAAILNYHWIEPAIFQSHLEFLSREFSLVSLDRVASYLSGEGELPPGAVALTFDDGYAAFHADLWPIVQAYRVPVTLFVATDPMDTGRPLWFNRLRAIVNAARPGPLRIGSITVEVTADRRAAYRTLMLRLHESREPADEPALQAALDSAPADPSVLEKYRPLSWEALRAMAPFVQPGAHTASHPNLARCSEHDALAEIRTSFERIRAELGCTVTSLAYPFGQPLQVNGQVEAAAQAAGATHAFTTVPGRVRKGDDPYRLVRFVCDDVPNGRVLAGLLGGLWPSALK